jgi:hypothetical protein
MNIITGSVYGFLFNISFPKKEFITEWFAVALLLLTFYIAAYAFRFIQKIYIAIIMHDDDCGGDDDGGDEFNTWGSLFPNLAFFDFLSTPETTPVRTRESLFFFLFIFFFQK